MTTHAIDGVPFETYATLVRVALFAPPTFSGGDVSLPYRAGERYGSRTRRGRDYATTWRVTATSEGAWNDKAAAFAEFVANDGLPFDLTRTRPGASGTVTETARAVYADGGEVERVGNVGTRWAGLVVVVHRLLAGRFEVAAP